MSADLLATHLLVIISFILAMFIGCGVALFLHPDFRKTIEALKNGTKKIQKKQNEQEPYKDAKSSIHFKFNIFVETKIGLITGFIIFILFSFFVLTGGFALKLMGFYES